jgi:hypothetical protein
VQPGETVTHTMWRSASEGGPDRIASETATETGALAVRDGLAVIRTL